MVRASVGMIFYSPGAHSKPERLRMAFSFCIVKKNASIVSAGNRSFIQLFVQQVFNEDLQFARLCEELHTVMGSGFCFCFVFHPSLALHLPSPAPSSKVLLSMNSCSLNHHVLCTLSSTPSPVCPLLHSEPFPTSS